MMISAVIPVLNEEACLRRALTSVIDQAGPYEIVVCDGGSYDDSVKVAREMSDRLVVAGGGRGPQICEGIRHCSGEIILILHADTILGPLAFESIRAALCDRSVSGGNFRVIFDGDTDFAIWLTRFYESLRSRGIYYGDSAMFVRRSVYEKIGGMKPLALMEDFEFVKRLERHGGTVCIDAPPVVTSSRRFTSRKRWRIITQWIFIHSMFYLRMPSALLARHYRSASHSPAIND